MESNQPSSPEHGPNVHLPQYEKLRQPEVSSERNERQESREQKSGVGAGDSAPKSQQPPQQQPVSHHMANDEDSGTDNTPLVTDDDTPLVAADEDLIEKAWVDKAKKIVASTRNDPYEQEREVSRLQADYLQKRYGKEVKFPNE